MNRIFKKVSSFFILALMGFQLSAQGATSGSSDLFVYILVGLAVLLFLGMLFNVPGLRQLRSKKTPAYASGKSVTNLSEGFDIRLQGAAENSVEKATSVTRYALQPTNFRGLQPIPKMTVAVGDAVKAGDQLFFDKQMADIQFVAPVSGEVIEINRGAKRAIIEIVILADKEQQYRSYNVPSLDASREDLVGFMKESGAWQLLRQRPYNVIPNPAETPRDIFISTFDSAPLAANADLVVQGNEEAFQAGVDVLAKLTAGKVHLGLDGRGEKAPSAIFSEAKNATANYFTGQHPVGNVGVQIHHTAPVGDDMVWTLGVQEVITLGRLFKDGRFDTSKVVALTGADLKKPVHVQTYAGANIGELLKNNIANDHIRYISGDVLSGEKKSEKGYMNWQDNQLTVVEEGDDHEMFGWIVPSEARPTNSTSFLSSAIGSKKEFKVNTNTHGGPRAFVTPTDYEQVLPMDIYLQHLMKAIIINDFERMEGLGLKELVEEDVAICEFVCVSKQPLQSLLREGLDVMREQS